CQVWDSSSKCYIF
nr:immunoglobulin light chain junction region [Macaca mulatta]MPO03624.1 immunoglobulin light chain junction region [Macaca mulatta]MPO04154.1 immunoglobulin light chain junction region [Macaca mulatta]MPO04556.1 immunoglobulin light chain junction region [Macaca mulatta]MPO04721.1 immunoglobulin light chain junction region [Macaca mulatta]